MLKLMRNSYATHIDYGAFKGLIQKNPNFVPSNIDGIAERKGQFLVMEWKRKGEAVSTGQRILLQSLASLHNFLVVIIEGNTDEELVVENFYLVQAQGQCILIGNGVQSFKEYYLQWYEYADQK
tara:strand:+ start:248 stop:619 length:372 start_codon:yes stop_codon:yes gene_type:complete